MVDVEFVRLSLEDERKALLILDASSEMAEVDASQLHALVSDCAFDAGTLAGFASDLLLSVGPAGGSGDDSDLPDSDPVEPAFDPLPV